MINLTKSVTIFALIVLAAALIGADMPDVDGADVVDISREEMDVIEQVSAGGANEAVIDILYNAAQHKANDIVRTVDGWTNRMIATHELANRARARGVSDDDPLIAQLREIWLSDCNDLQMIAKTISKEAGACPYWHMVAVGAVILNRVADPRFPDTVYEVLTQTNPVQYSASYTYDFTNISDQHYQAAIDAMNRDHDVPANVVWQAEFFQGSGIWETSPVWTPWYSSVTYFCY